MHPASCPGAGLMGRKFMLRKAVSAARDPEVQNEKPQHGWCVPIACFSGLGR